MAFPAATGGQGRSEGRASQRFGGFSRRRAKPFAEFRSPSGLAKLAGLRLAERRALAREELAGPLSRLGIVRAPEALDEDSNDLADTDHPEQILALEHRQVADLALAHQAGGLEDVVVR